MSEKEYIESGLLELYVYGQLSEAENLEVQKMMAEYPGIKLEVEAIENAVINLSQSVAPRLSVVNFEKIRNKILDNRKIEPIPSKSNWSSLIYWGAAIATLLALGFLLLKWNEANQSKNQLRAEKAIMQETIDSCTQSKNQSDRIMAVLRDNNFQTIALAGQTVSPTSYAKIYYNKISKEVYVDVQGLPAPPTGSVYQVWSLKLSPLTPTSIGTLDNFIQDNVKVFKVANAEEAEAFGITLEPAGGSVSPTLEKLYTLGKV